MDGRRSTVDLDLPLGLVDDHLKHCVVDAATTGGPGAEDKLTEASKAIARLVKS